MLRKHRPCPCPPAPRWAGDIDALHKVLGHCGRDTGAHSRDTERAEPPAPEVTEFQAQLTLLQLLFVSVSVPLEGA